MIISKKSISNINLALVFTLISLEPAYFQNIRIIDTIYDVGQLLMFIIVVYLQIELKPNGRIKQKVFKDSIICWILVIYYFYLFFITLINRGLALSVLMQGIQFIGFAFFIDIVLKENPKIIFDVVLNVLTLYIFVNLICVIIFPQGMYDTSFFNNNYFLGYDNQNINFLLPALVLVLLKNKYRRSCKMHIAFVYIISWITVIKVWSGMSLVLIALMTCIGIVTLNKHNEHVLNHILNGKIFNFVNFLFVNIAMFFALVVFHLQYYFEYIIVVILKKNMTLTSRIKIWDRNITIIKNNPFVGYGKEQYEFRAQKLGFNRNSPAGLHAHNRFIETQYRGGIVLLGLYMFMLVYAAKKLYVVRDSLYAKILGFGLFVYMVGMLTEFYDYCIFFWAMLVMAENAKRVLNIIQ